jgi:hypothetical protein
LQRISRGVRNDLSHLPQKQQDELERAKRILMEEFANARRSSPKPTDALVGSWINP